MSVVDARIRRGVSVSCDDPGSADQAGLLGVLLRSHFADVLYPWLRSIGLLWKDTVFDVAES